MYFTNNTKSSPVNERPTLSARVHCDSCLQLSQRFSKLLAEFFVRSVNRSGLREKSCCLIAITGVEQAVGQRDLRFSKAGARWVVSRGAERYRAFRREHREPKA